MKLATPAVDNTRPAHRLFVGTAAWSIPRNAAEVFPTGRPVLVRYAKRFRAVEINTSFYRPHRRATYERWSATTPEGFRFAVKAPRQITHLHRLIGVDALMTAFCEQIEGLGDALGPVLFQLPPSLAFDPAVAGPFFELWRAVFDGFTVCEPRHSSWFNDAASRLLIAAKVARVAADPAPYPDAGVPGGFDGLAYYRLHGSPVMYDSSYASRLDRIAQTLTDSAIARPTWCIFDNTKSGAATLDALSLVSGLAPKAPRDAP